MITQLRGRLVEKNPTYVVVDCNGVGYLCHISLHTYGLLPSEELITIYTHLSIKEDAHTLFGFISKIEREIFRLLISVSGVGPSIARTMLSSMTAEEIQQAIASGNVALIQSVKGIGAKTAQRLILDLKDKILKTFDLEEMPLAGHNTNKEEALSALEVLGFTRKISEKVLDRIIKTEADLTVEQLIKKALKSF
ncbi:Holliday junction branch migration protein RuvA [Flavicella sediminum]|uniref:Holliday junction branch migration protein RuvA n=1 Tax=Flavicella sediminum TaxID=2585141 RepID=UPI001121586C|nr:Holliday junction branch migration protein RuvA [Flavicella sediminum]